MFGTATLSPVSITEVVGHEPEDEKTLAGVLNRLGIGVIPKADVRAFQRRVSRRVRLQRKTLGVFAGLLVAAMGLLGLVVPHVWSIPLVWVQVLSVVGTIVIIGSAFLAFSIGDVYTRWGSCHSSMYLRSMPAEVGAMVKRVREVIPKADFYVEYLKVIQDPFLWVRYKGGEYCLAHWDEKGFQEP